MRRVCAKEATLPTTMGRTMLAAWTAELDAMDARLASRFGRAELRDRARDYLRGLLPGAERKNGWQLAEEVGNTTPYGLQHLVGRASWDADAVRDDLREAISPRSR